MSIELGNKTASLLPTPEFPMKPEEKRFFSAEQKLLAIVSREICPGAVSPQERKQGLFRYLSDLSSTEMAEEVLFSYGCIDGVCYSSNELGRKYKVANHTIDTNTRVVMQSLWLLHSSSIPAELYAFAQVLDQRYARRGVQVEGHQQRILERAESNVFYYEDRLFILEKEEENLKLLRGLYGKGSRDIFARYYRLAEFKDAESFERRGNCVFHSQNAQERLAFYDALEAGHATIEYIYDLKPGSKDWTDIRGKREAGFRRKGTRFEIVLQEYQEQLEIAEAIQDPIIRQRLGVFPLELLELTTQARLSGLPKNEGLAKFNQKYNTSYTLNDVKVLQDKVLIDYEENRLVILDRTEKIKELTEKAPLRNRLAQILADIVYDFHVEGYSNRIIAEEIDLPVVNWYSLTELRKFLDIQILESQGCLVRERPQRGEVTKEMIDSFFGNDDLPTKIIDLLSKIGPSQDLAGIAQESYPNWRGVDHALSALRRLAVEVVREDQAIVQPTV